MFSILGACQRGIVGVYFAIVVLIVMFGIGMTLAFHVFSQQKIISNTLTSLQAYYGAEAGIEDALIRLRRSMNWTNPYTFQVAGASSEITISPLAGGSRTITAKGSSANRVRTAQIVYQLSTEDIAFNFGAHIGNPSLLSGGLTMQHSGGKIIGNVFSNADIEGSGRITDSVIVAGAGNEIEDVTINGNAEAYTCDGATILGNLEYNSAGSNSCSVGGSITTTGDVIAPVAFPITPGMLADWKATAEAGGIVDGGGNVNIGSGGRTLGPSKITGNLTINNGETLTLTGTLWVTGIFSPGNNAVVELDDEYGDLSGALIVDGMVDISNLVILRGSGTPGSFLLLIGTSSSLLEASPAISIKNNTDSAVIFAPNGVIVIHNNANLVEVTAHKLLIKKATVTYDVGLADARFTSGPGAGWVVSSWKEIE